MLPTKILTHFNKFTYYKYTDICITSGSAARHPSLYLALRALPWIRISQSYDVDMSDVDTTHVLFAAATASGTTDSWQ